MITRRSMMAAGAVALAAPAVRAQGSWPDKPLRFVIGGAAGGVSDIFLRMMENRLRERLGQPMIIDPRPVPHQTAIPITSITSPHTGLGPHCIGGFPSTRSGICQGLRALPPCPMC